jgi:hypothetical protein
MLHLIAQHEDFSIYTFDHKCYTMYDLGGSITDCIQGYFIVKMNDIEVFKCHYTYESWYPERTINIYKKEGIYDISHIRTILKSMPLNSNIMKAMIAYKKNELRF